MVANFVTSLQHLLLVPAVLQSTTTTTTTLDISKYGGFPFELWGWTDFAIGLSTGVYFPLRDHWQSDCLSGVYNTASQFFAINKMFNLLPKDGWEWTQFSVEPLFGLLHATETAFVCL